MATSLGARIKAANTALIVNGNLGTIGKFFAPGYLAHLTGRDMKGGHEAVRRFLKALRRAFPVVRIEVEVLVESRNRVAWQRTLRGVQRGAYKGFRASGRRIVWRDVVTSRFLGGLIAEDWVITDLAERLLLARKR